MSEQAGSSSVEDKQCSQVCFVQWRHDWPRDLVILRHRGRTVDPANRSSLILQVQYQQPVVTALRILYKVALVLKLICDVVLLHHRS